MLPGEALVERRRWLELVDSPGEVPAHGRFVEREVRSDLLHGLSGSGQTGNALLGRRQLGEFHAPPEFALLY
jgi:hypothetical protein